MHTKKFHENMGLHIFKLHHLFYTLLNITVSPQKPTLLLNLWKTCKYKTMIIEVKLKPHLFPKKTEKIYTHCR